MKASSGLGVETAAGGDAELEGAELGRALDLVGGFAEAGEARDRLLGGEAEAVPAVAGA